MKPIKTPSNVQSFLGGASNFQIRKSSTSSDSLSAPQHIYDHVRTSEKQNLIDSNFDNLVQNLSNTMSMTQTSGMLSTSNSTDLLSVSPIFGNNFENQAFNESLLSVDNDLIRGIRNINYDIDFSESPENSLAEEIAEIRKYSGMGLIKESSEDAQIDRTTKNSRNFDDFAEFDPLMEKPELHAEEACLTRSLIDESPNDLLLENPLLPTKNDYHGLSSQTSKIQSINCKTGKQ